MLGKIRFTFKDLTKRKYAYFFLVYLYNYYK